MDNLRISIVIVGYNSAAVIGQCLRDLDIQDDDSVEVILIDNSSMDSTVEVFKENCPSGRVILREDNAGFAVAVNEAVKKSSGQSIALLNPDASISTTDLCKLASRLNAEVQIVGPIVGGSDHRTIPAGRYPSVWRMFLHCTGLSSLSALSTIFEGHYLLFSEAVNTIRKVDWVTGGCMVVSRECWVDLGGLTERWFMYGEDIEFCTRASRRGAGIVLDGTVIVRHEIGGSTAGVDGKASVTWLKNLYDMYLVTRPRPSRLGSVAWRLSVTIGYGARAIVYKTASLVPPRSPALAVRARNFGAYSRALLRD